MKRYYKWFTGLLLIMLLVLFLVFSPTLKAEIPNANFESWFVSGEMNLPDGWYPTHVPRPDFIVFYQNPSSYSGASALKGLVQYDAVRKETVWADIGTQFPVFDRPKELIGHYKFSSVNGDEFMVVISLWAGEEAVGLGLFKTADSQSGYEEFQAEIIYISEKMPIRGEIYVKAYSPPEVESIFQAHALTSYTVDAFSLEGTGEYTMNAGSETAVKPVGRLPSEMALHPCYPNPFNPATSLNFTLDNTQNVKLCILNSLGEMVKQFSLTDLGPGTHSVVWDGHNDVGLPMSSGTYIYTLSGEDFIQSRQMILIK